MEDPGQSISLLDSNQDADDYEYDDGASLSDDDSGAMAETALDSPVAVPSGEYGRYPERTPTADSSHSETGTSSSTGVKEPRQNAMKLPLDQTDYLQPQSSLPATYLDLVSTPGNHSTITITGNW